MIKNYTDLEVRVREFARKDEGAGLVEYALLVALIAILLIGALLFLSGAIGDVFSDAGDGLTNTP